MPRWNLFPARSRDDRQTLDDPLNASTGSQVSQATCGPPVAASTPAKAVPMAGESVTENDLQVTAMSDKNYDVRTAPPPISYESDQRCRTALVRSLTYLYCMILIVLGLVFPLTFFLSGGEKDSSVYLSVFHIYIYLAALVFLIYAHIAITYHKRALRAMDKRTAPTEGADNAGKAGDKNGQLPYESGVAPETEEEDGKRPDVEAGVDKDHKVVRKIINTDGDQRFSPAGLSRDPGTVGTMEQLTLEGVELEDLPFYYAKSGINFFLRLGFIVFGMGSMVLDGFRLVHFAHTDKSWHCYGLLFMVHTSLRLVYVFALTFFVFKNHRVVINFHHRLVKLGLMHTLATNICIWFITLILETSESYFYLEYGKKANNTPYTNTPAINFQPIDRGLASAACHSQRALADRASPYLYPCVIQFCLIGAAILYQMYSNMGNGTPCRPFQEDKSRYMVECRKATTGLFLGLFILTISTICICFFLLYDTSINPLTIEVTTIVYHIGDLSVNAVALIVTIIAFMKTRQLYFSEDFENTFSIKLLFIALTGFYLLVCFALVPSITTLSEGSEMESLNAKLTTAVSVVSFIQGTVQIVFILDALRRRAEERYHQKTKPGRSLVTFLILCNVSLWLANTLALKEAHQSPLFINFYGRLAWIVVMHICLPMTIFYRFHSSICLSEVWVTAYTHTS